MSAEQKATATSQRVRKNGWCEAHQSRESLGSGRCLAWLHHEVPESTSCEMTDQWIASSSCFTCDGGRLEPFDPDACPDCGNPVGGGSTQGQGTE